MADYKVIMVNPDQLVPSPHQPDSRTKAISAMNHLVNSIRDDKLQYPPLVLALAESKEGEPQKYQIIDGHRRVAAMNELGYPKIPVLPTVGQPAELFAAVSGNVAKMKSYEWIDVHLRGGIVPPGPNRGCIIAIEKIMGRDFLVSLKDKGMSPAIWNLANRVVAYMGVSAEETRPKILNWLIKIGTREVSAWITNANSKSELTKAFEQTRSPKFG